MCKFGRHSPVGMAERASVKKAGCSLGGHHGNIAWLDLQILFQTLPAVIEMRGAY